MTGIKATVWGLGPHAINKILPALNSTPGISLYGVSSRNSEIVNSVCAERGCVGWTDPDEMLADENVDVVYVSTPIGLHAEHGMRVLKSGKHLWCEKPLAENSQQLEPLLQTSRTQGKCIAEGFMYLYHRQFAFLREVVRSHRVGTIHTVCCVFGLPPLENPRFRNSRELGGGAFLDVGSYPISAVCSLFEECAAEVVDAEIASFPESEVDSYGRALVRFHGGPLANLAWRVGCGYRNEIDLWGTTGSVFTQRFFSKPADYSPTFEFLDLHGAQSCTSVPAQDAFVAMFEGFSRLMTDAGAAENERLTIARRTGLMDRIRERASTQET